MGNPLKKPGMARVLAVYRGLVKGGAMSPNEPVFPVIKAG